MRRIIFKLIFTVAAFASVGGWLWLLALGGRWLIGQAIILATTTLSVDAERGRRCQSLEFLAGERTVLYTRADTSALRWRTRS
jgi:hypothetical protein